MILTLLLLPIFGCLAAALLPTNARNRESWLSGALALAGLLITLTLYFRIPEGGALYYQVAWMPQYGLEFSLRMNGLSWLFTLLVQGVGLLVVLYARYYMSPKDPVPRFFSFFMAFMAAMLGVVLSGNLIQLLVFWELTSFTSFLLIGYWHHRIDARRGARMAFTVTAAGGLCLLAGILLIGHIVGSYALDDVLAAGDAIREHRYYLPILILVALGALTKSAQFPFHFWLPHAMAAPTPVSAYLHSATMVKAGIFLLMLLWPVLSGTSEWSWIIAGAGVATFLIGSFFAIFQHDLKGLLAYSTISHLGLIVALLGFGSSLGVVAAIFHTVNHAIFKASLFMAAGIIDHETGTRDMRVLRGLRRSLPITATLAIVASASMAGVPLLNGFLSKEMFFAEAVAASSRGHWWISAAAVAMGMFSVAYSLRFISVFFGKEATDLPQQPHEPPRWMRFPVELLVLLCLLVGIVPALSIAPILASAATSVLGEALPYYSLSLWHGFNLPLLMSIVALSGGIVLYWWLRTYYHLASSERIPLFHRLNGARLYDMAMLRLSLASGTLLKGFGTTRLQSQLLLILVALVAVLLLLTTWPISITIGDVGMVDWLFAMAWLIGCACAVAAAWYAKYRRLTALILVGGTGLITSMSFLWLSAPDLALTQLMVETVTTVLILLGLRWLPPRILPSQLKIAVFRPAWLYRSRDLVVAVLGGIAMAVTTYVILMRQPGESVSEFFVLRARPEGGGTNIVNILLVDFRAFDTLGEITVLAIVSLTVYALLRRFRPAPESAVLPPQQINPIDPAVSQPPAAQADEGYLKIVAVYTRFLLPIMVLIAAYFFLRGHNLPGGGFVAGLILAVALIIQYMVAGTAWVELHLRLQAHKWVAWGVLIACGTGLGAWLLGYPFLTSHTAHVHLPLLGEIHLPSAFMFDLGVFAAVVGSTMLILVALSHQSVRGHRLAEEIRQAQGVKK